MIFAQTNHAVWDGRGAMEGKGGQTNSTLVFGRT